MDAIAQAYLGLTEKVRGMLSGRQRRENAAQSEKQLYVDTADNRAATEGGAKKYERTLANLSKYALARTKEAMEKDIGKAVDESISFLESQGWNCWKFPEVHAEVLRFGVVLDWPQYKNHLPDQTTVLKKVCDTIGGRYVLHSCGAGATVAGGAYALYLGFKPGFDTVSSPQREQPRGRSARSTRHAH